MRPTLAENWALNDVPAPIVVYDGEGRAVEANDQAYSLLGLTPGALLGASPEESGWLVVESVEGPITVHPVVAALRSGQRVRGVLVRARRPGGADVWLLVDAIPQPGGDRVVATLTDVTHLIAVSNRLDESDSLSTLLRRQLVSAGTEGVELERRVT